MHSGDNQLITIHVLPAFLFSWKSHENVPQIDFYPPRGPARVWVSPQSRLCKYQLATCLLKTFNEHCILMARALIGSGCSYAPLQGALVGSMGEKGEQFLGGKLHNA